MKNSTIVKFYFIGLLMLDFGCSEIEKPDHTINSLNLDLSEEILDELAIISVSEKLKVLNGHKAGQRIDPALYERELKVALSPLVDNGRLLHSKIIGALEKSDEFSRLAQAEKSRMYQFDEVQFAELSFLMSQAQNGNRNVNIDPQVMACLGVASGVVGIYDLIRNTSALGSVTSVTKALKLLGRRSLGWVGVGIMIVDFTTCYYGAA
jgi:hypothetical protein